MPPAAIQIIVASDSATHIYRIIFFTVKPELVCAIHYFKNNYIKIIYQNHTAFFFYYNIGWRLCKTNAPTDRPYITSPNTG